MLSICKNHTGCKNYHRFPFSILIKIFSQSLEGWQQIQVRQCFRKIRIYREPQVAHVPSVGQNPLQVTILIPCRGQARAQTELCHYSAATQRRVGTKAPRSGERAGLWRRTFSLESKVRRRLREKYCPVYHSTKEMQCKQTHSWEGMY